MVQRVLLVLICFCSFMARAEDTVLKLYRPFGDSPRTIKRQVTGQCLSQSKLILREDAWRCMAEDGIYDPCFVKQLDKKIEVLCPTSPWSKDSVQIIVKASLNNDQHERLDMSRAYPWAIELLSGERCQAFESNQVFDNMPVRYRCSGENYLIGYLQRCKTVWSMLEKTSTGVNTVDFKKVWF